MWKLALTGVWCVGVSLTAVYADSRFTPSPEEPEARYPILTEHEVVKSEMVTGPMFAADSLRSELVDRMNSRVGMQADHNTLLTRLDYPTVNDLERMRKPGGNQMKSTPIVDKAALNVVPAPAKGN